MSLLMEAHIGTRHANAKLQAAGLTACGTKASTTLFYFDDSIHEHYPDKVARNYSF
jgi:hypothetical protein